MKNKKEDKKVEATEVVEGTVNTDTETKVDETKEKAEVVKDEKAKDAEATKDTEIVSGEESQNILEKNKAMEEQIQNVLAKPRKLTSMQKIIIGVSSAVALATAIIVPTVILVNSNSKVELQLQYTVDGLDMDNVVLSKGATIKDLPIPTKEGYKFVGWYKDEKCTDAYGENEVLTEKSKIYVKLEISQYSVSAYIDGVETKLAVELTETNLYNYLTTHVFGENKTYDDTTTCGWYLDENLKTPVDANTVVENNMTVYTRVATLDKLNFVANEEVYSVEALNEEITGEVVIPKMYNGKQVTAIVAAMYNPYHAYLSDDAFANCTDITKVIFPDTISSIGQASFMNCTNLSDIIFVGDVKIENISDFSFHNTNLTKLNIPNSLKSIGSYAFSDNSSLTELNFEKDSKLETINLAAFQSTRIASLNIPKTLTSISANAFDKNFLEIITVEEGNTTYDSRGDCNAIIHTSSNRLIMGCSRTIIPSDVKYIGGFAFSNGTDERSTIIDSSAITSIIIPASVETLENEAFYACNNLTTVTFAQGSMLKSIEWSAFTLCASLNDIIIPSSVTTLGDNVFSECDGLKTITIDSDTILTAMKYIQSCGSLAEKAQVVYIKNDITSESLYISGYFTKQDVSDREGYTKYTKGK